MKHNWKKNENGTIDEFAWESGFHNGVICVDCGKTVCVCCHPDYMEMDDCNGKPKQTPITNADRIRGMSDEELAMVFIHSPCHGQSCDTAPHTEFGSADCMQCQIKWLRQPAEGEQHG